MKKFSKILSVALLVALVLSLGITNAFAADNQTIRVQNAVPGETYKIYKMLDLSVDNPANPTAFRYAINSDWSAFWTGTGAGAAYINTNTVDGVTYVTWKTDKQTAADMEAFGKVAAAFAANKTPAKPAIEAPAATGDNKTVSIEFTGLDLGYYLVTSTLGTAASVASTPESTNNDIIEKNEGNDTDKKVQEDSKANDPDGGWGKANDAQVGQEVFFRSTAEIVKNSKNVVYHDVMTSGLSWTGASKVEVYTLDASGQKVVLGANDCTVAAGAANSGDTFTVTFSESYLNAVTATTTVYIAYSAILNDNAVVGTAELNTPSITWGNNGRIERIPTQTKTYKFTIWKYNGADADKKVLAGAEFKLYTKDITLGEDQKPVVDTPLKLCKNEAGTIYRVVDMTDDGATLPNGFSLVTNDTIVTVADTVITVEGIDADDYYLEETKAPEGYNPIEGRQKVTVSSTADTVANVPNNTGAVLPSTGGIGTTIFYVVGGVLVLAAIILLVTKKRMSE